MKLSFYILSLIATAFFLQFPIIHLENYYSGEGVIFDKTVHYPFVEPTYSKPYKPNIEDIKFSEKFISEHYYEYKTNVLDSFHLDKSVIKLKYKQPKNVINKYYKYNRQYAGFINKNNDTIVYVGLLNFENKKKANNYFEGWKENIFFGFDGFYEKNQENFLINLSKKEFVYKLITGK